MVFYRFLLSAFLGGLIGWVTNWIAIKALFRPRKPVNIGFFQFQGLLPKRQPELAENLGKVVEGELIKLDELIKKVEPSDIEPIIDDIMKQNRDDIERRVKEYISSKLQKIPFFKISASGVVDSIMNKLETEVSAALKKQLPNMLDRAAEKAAQKISVREIVSEKVHEMDLDKLENIFYKISEKEMSIIIRLGGVIGAIVGLLHQVMQLYLI